MNKYKESLIYLNFLKDNLYLIMIFGIITVFISFFYINSKPDKLMAEAGWQMAYQAQNLNDRTVLTDHAVSLIRSVVLESQIGVNPQDDIKVFKSGPLLINLTDIGENQENLKVDIKNIDNYLTLNFPLTQIGQPNYKHNPKPFLIFGLISFAVGSLIGLLISLIRFYLKNY